MNGTDVHEIRDPIHVFVRLDSYEREILNSRPFQRLRHIHQLALTYLVYPAATHKRFEHSLGVMELAGRVFDVMTRNASDQVKDALPELKNDDALRYWRRVLRMAALCHDIGHLPFSHAAEKQLLPQDWDHERLTCGIIASGDMQEIWHRITPPLRHEDVVKLAVGPQHAKTLDGKNLQFSDWETLLSEIIVGDAFGVDRMDYLLRDSHHVGVAYGRFDHYRLVDTLRILPVPSGSSETALGIEEGGIQSAEALMLARYFMYSQVYFHAIRRIYDIHLADFLKQWLRDGKFSTDITQHLSITDNEVTSALLEAAFDLGKPGHDDARRIVAREHFKVLYARNPTDVQINPEAGAALFHALGEKFSPAKFRHDRYRQASGAPDFPVRLRDGQIVSSLAVSETLTRVPVVSVDYIFADRTIISEANRWMKAERTNLIRPREEGEIHE